MSTVIHPGDIKFHSVILDGADITSFTVYTNVFQDIFTPFWSAQIAMADTQNLIMNLPIKPGSKVEIIIETDGPKPCTGRKKFVFYIYKITEHFLEKQDTQGYMLHAITKQFFDNQKVRISKAFKEMTPQALVGEFISNIDGSLQSSDNDPTKYNLTIPNWSPIAACEWVARFAKESGPKGADWIVYQSDMDKFKFKSLEKMFKDSSGLRLKQMDPNVRSNPSIIEEDSFINIQGFNFLQHHDAVKNYHVGYYANTVITHDIVNKTITHTPFKYGDDIPADGSKPPFDGKMFDDAELSNYTFYPMHPGILDGLTPEETQTSWMGSRKTNMLKLEENRLLLQLPGFVCGWNWLGKSAYIELPSHQDKDRNEKLDKYFKGDYLITAIKHVVKHGNYELIMELGKKRLQKAYE